MTPADKMTPTDHMVCAGTAQEVFNHVQKLPHDTVILLDVDDTLITPVSRTFRSTSKGDVKNLIDEIKANKKEYPDFDAIISSWRLQRQVRLTDPAWPQVLETLKKTYLVYGLTQMNTGKFGEIPSVEQWRYEELKALGLTFSDVPEALKTPKTVESQKELPVFYQGIMMTGSASKAETLQSFSQDLRGSTIVMVDDRQKHLDDIATFCKKEQKNFLGILYQEIFTDNRPQDPDVYALQKKMLCERYMWLEDDAALQLISS